MPIQYIHEPWTAPENVQRAAKCIIGKDYPLPMVNHASASRINIQRMKQVYQQLANYRTLENVNCTSQESFKDGYQHQPPMATVSLILKDLIILMMIIHRLSNNLSFWIRICMLLQTIISMMNFICLDVYFWLMSVFFYN